jgi:hypothetical protein
MRSHPDTQEYQQYLRKKTINDDQEREKNKTQSSQLTRCNNNIASNENRNAVVSFEIEGGKESWINKST